MTELANEYAFTNRIEAYRERFSYGLDHTHIGIEYGLGVFAVETAVATIDSLHAVVYPHQSLAKWLRINRTVDGLPDIQAILSQEPMLQVNLEQFTPGTGSNSAEADPA